MYRFRKSRFTIRLPKTVPPNVKRAFEALIPTFSLLTVIWLLEWFVSSHTIMVGKEIHQLTIPSLLMQLFQPLVVVQDSYPAALLEIILMMLLWSVGIHGMNIVTAMALPFWLTTIASNANGGHGIVTEPFFHIFAHLGGSGATWPLNINEPVTFGVPMVLNPIMMIPFIFVPALIVTINYIAFSLGLVHVPIVMQPFTVPLGISGFIATGGDFRGSLLQFFDLAISALIYYPFFKAWESTLIAREEAATQEESHAAMQAAMVQPMGR
jgi:PTS system cellobiose-specific IIC component